MPASNSDKALTIGRFRISAPASHMLDVYQEKFKLYDWPLGEIARLVQTKYPAATVVDIGANIGDSAAILCRHGDLPILCIEGSPIFLSYLRRNLPRLPHSIEIAACLLGPASGTVPRRTLLESGGTARIDPASGLGAAEDPSQALLVRTLGDVLQEHRRFITPRLIKIDTDGGDFAIILSSMDVIDACHPVLFFEYSLAERKDSLKESIAAISRLVDAGYRQFFVYDNFGNFLQIVSDNAANVFRDMNRYLMSHLIAGRQIYYFDVCAFAAADEDLALALYRYQSQMIDEGIRGAGWQM